jgi:serine/threonine protein kinase
MLTAGTTVSGYRIESLLGEGGMGAVYEAHQASLNRVVALKILARKIGDDDAFRERFRRECEIQARLDHPNIVPVYEAGESEYGLWLAMRMVKGPTLRELLAERMSPGRALELLAPIAGALDVAHGHGLIHRDITPQNILVNEHGHPYLADFGITKSRGDRSLTRTGQFVGTLDYVAPEQIQDEPTGAPTDIYSLTAILFECLTGRVPFAKQSEAAVLFAHIADEPPRATELDPSLPAAIDAVLRQGLAKAPADRFGSATALVDAARDAFEQPAGERVAPAPEPLQPTLGEHPPAIRDGRTRTGAKPRSAATTATDPPETTTPSEQGGDSLQDTRPDGSRRLRRALLPALAALLLSAIALGVGAATSGDSQTPAKPSPVAAGKVEVEPPGDWASKGKAAIGGLGLADPVTLTPPQPPGPEAVVVGVSQATGKTLLPADLLAASGGAPRGEAVSLGSLQALRYRGLRSRKSSDPLTVFVSPASVGVATVACRPAPPRRREFLRRCESIATTLSLTEGRPFPLGPSPTLAAALRRQVSALAERRGALRRRLSAAGSAKRQAAVATQLAAAFRRTAHSLSSLGVTPQSAAGLAAVTDALRSTRDAYKELATAARHEDAAAYRAASASVDGAESAVDRALLALRPLGYPIAENPLRAPGGSGGGNNRGGADAGDAPSDAYRGS